MKKLALIITMAALSTTAYARDYGDTSYGMPGGQLLTPQQNYEAQQYQQREYEARQAHELRQQQQQMQQQYDNDRFRQQQNPYFH